MGSVRERQPYGKTESEKGSIILDPFSEALFDKSVGLGWFDTMIEISSSLQDLGSGWSEYRAAGIDHTMEPLAPPPHPRLQTYRSYDRLGQVSYYGF